MRNFNPKAHVIQLFKSKKVMEWQIVGGIRKQVEVWKKEGQDYLEVKWRLVWFRNDHPLWSLQTEVKYSDFVGSDKFAVVLCKISCVVSDEGDRVLSTGHGCEYEKNFKNFLEKAETAAVGRALAQLGYGTQFAPELEDKDRIVDAPVEGGKKQGDLF